MNYTCKYCGKKFENKYALNGHVSHCEKNDGKKRTIEFYSNVSKQSRKTYINNHPEKYVKKKYTLYCKKCGLPYTLDLTEDEFKKEKYTKYCSINCRNSHKLKEETKRKISASIKKSSKHYIAPNKEYTCKYCGKKFTVKTNNYCGGRKYCSDDCRKKWLEEEFYFKKKHGYGKSGWYNGIHCDSSWELAFVIYHVDKNLPIKRCTEKRTYIFKEKTYKYYPDFVTNDGIIEIKGYKNEKWFAKISQNKDIKVLNKNEMKPYLDYAISTYGKDFTKLYDQQ